MIIFVDMEHDRLRLEKPDYWLKLCARRMAAKNRLEEICGAPCLLLGYQRFSPELIRRLEPTLVVFSGNNTDFSRYDANRIQLLQTYFLNPSHPTFCICGSFQLMAQAFGANIGPMGKETDRARTSMDPIIPDSAIHENGFSRVRIDHVAAGLLGCVGTEVLVHQHHFWEVKDVPIGFWNLASSELWQIRSIQHDALPIAGAQFHTEDYDREHPDGSAILKADYFWARERCS